MSGNPPFRLKPMRAMMRPLFESHRVKCLYGGRGSGKSWDVAEALIEIAVRSEVRILCLRRVQKSIAASSHQLLCDTIRRLGYESEFTITNNAIRSKEGAEFMFMGLQSNLDSVKSIEGVDICWVEEAHSISREAGKSCYPLYAASFLKCGSRLTRITHGMTHLSALCLTQRMTGLSCRSTGVTTSTSPPNWRKSGKPASNSTLTATTTFGKASPSQKRRARWSVVAILSAFLCRQIQTGQSLPHRS